MRLKDTYNKIKKADDLKFIQLMVAVGIIFFVTLISVIGCSIYYLW